MRRSRFTEDQIIGVLREHEVGVKTADLFPSLAAARRIIEAWNLGGLAPAEFTNRPRQGYESNEANLSAA